MEWYLSNPELLEKEKLEMKKYFPNFTLDKLEDGRLYWMGELNPGIYETKFGVKKTYTVMAVYNNNHPEQVMGTSVIVYPILPDIGDIINECGFIPRGLLRDSSDNLYPCLSSADLGTKSDLISILARAVKWFCGLELVLTGDIDAEEFNRKI